MQEGTTSSAQLYDIDLRQAGRQIRFDVRLYKLDGSPWGGDPRLGPYFVDKLLPVIRQVIGVERATREHVTSMAMHFRVSLAVDANSDEVIAAIKQIVAAFFRPPEQA